MEVERVSYKAALALRAEIELDRLVDRILEFLRAFFAQLPDKVFDFVSVVPDEIQQANLERVVGGLHFDFYMVSKALLLQFLAATIAPDDIHEDPANAARPSATIS